ncbi:MAG: hypothetical protein WDZ35_08670 [Crocinitomicaceae bacterium]
MNMNKLKVFDNHFMRLEWKDDIVYGLYKDVNVDLEMAKNVVKNRLEFTNHESVPLLVREAKFKGFDRDARQYLSSEEGLKGILAGAIVVKTAFSSHLANFFLKISMGKPKIPAKVFSSEAEAENWLREMVKEFKE